MQGKYINCYKNLAFGRKLMYKFERYHQLGLADFNSRSTCMKIMCTRFLTGSSVSASPTSVRLSGERQLHPWSSGQRWIAAAEQYFERTGHYPERILADKIYRNRNNLVYCREHGIRLSGPSLGRPKENATTDRKTEYEDNADRIAVERAFALAKQKYRLGLITSRLDETTGSSIVLSVIAMNVDRISRSLLRLFFDIVFSRCKQYEFMLINIQNNNAENLACC